jgi:SAM-dependent methyltransferase
VSEVDWHDVECASYAADLPIWRDLARAHGAGGLLDLGAGTGRVALDLALRDHDVTALDADADLLDALAQRARAAGARVDTIPADARSFALGRTFGLILAPMQVAQLLGGPAGRLAMLGRVRDHLDPGGLFAAAVADPFEAVPAEESLPPLPDVRERDGWVLSSQPVAVRPVDGGVAIDRVRQRVSPQGDLTEERATILLDSCSAETLEAEGAQAGLLVRERLQVAETHDHIGSTIVMLERPR